MGKRIGGFIGVAVGAGLYNLFQPHWLCWLGVVMAFGSLFQLITALFGEKKRGTRS